MKKILLLVFTFLAAYQYTLSQNVGIGTITPQARLHVTDSSVLFSAMGDIAATPGNTPVSGAGRRMMWYPDKAAFRAGYVTGVNWNKDSIGVYSFATGYNSKASGGYSSAIGLSSSATFEGATAIGINALSTGMHSTAIGDNARAIGWYSTAIGTDVTSSGNYNAIAIGSNSIAAANYATAIGNYTTASGVNSTALGINANTNGNDYSFCIGGSKLTTYNTVDSQMMMRFSNYTFWVTPSNYAYLIPSSNGWAYTSDRNKKERLEELNGETVLQKISDIPFYSWNFKDASTRQYRHYGIMAQDFFAAFGKDSYGNIGNDTTVSPLDMLGVDMAAIKALEKRSSLLAKDNDQLKTDNLALQLQLEAIKTELAKTNTKLANKLALLEMKLDEAVATKEKAAETKTTIAINK